ncbi:hypothetical protein KY345_04050 [Candidatus Woesearchaeota archaeon]|nr:hypothetical protein [Candidatus Woesearchaeota archaeon]
MQHTVLEIYKEAKETIKKEYDSVKTALCLVGLDPGDPENKNDVFRVNSLEESVLIGIMDLSDSNKIKHMMAVNLLNHNEVIYKNPDSGELEIRDTKKAIENFLLDNPQSYYSLVYFNVCEKIRDK